MIRRRGRDSREATLEALHDANAADLLSYFGRRVSVPADAADLLSETFVVAWRRIDRMPSDPEQARMWLFGVARRLLANAARGSVRRTDLNLRLRQQLEAQPEAADPAAIEVREALDRLPANQGELVRLILWDGFTLPQAAEILGVKESTARGRYQRARIRLRELLRPDEPQADAPGLRRARAART
ncbi:RNA polymerase sigma-70 factor (ECF subfamily) [Pseudoclavibacter sp. JAI123]|uniref:RNA polymerase sigma factor n=1 Tax=Pseudoclavibacter sp. JAI123 TaxID=2723065 RepID=UPI00180CCEDB|nr:sigma-70 family RNA polymerase sigma factor [Pseudoclavibacter sp. JAI123]NYF14831.1 RNA polymerase sigma-70 factor (ECF subfamily) [Pseudoclavibacter sp. JAI123]